MVKDTINNVKLLQNLKLFSATVITIILYKLCNLKNNSVIQGFFIERQTGSGPPQGMVQLTIKNC